MANLSSFSMIHQKVCKAKNDYDLESNGVAFAWVVLESIFQFGDDEVEDVITDGGNDAGIDAIFFEEQTVHVFNFKYADNFENSQKNFPESEFDKLINTFGKLFEKNINESDVNDLLWPKIEEIWALFENGPVNFKVYLCSNKEKPIPNASAKLEKSLEKYRAFEFIYWDQDEVASRIIEKKYRKATGELTFVDKQYFERTDGSLKGIVATVPANDLIKILQNSENPNKVNEDVFNENIRLFKKNHRINQNIKATALSEENYEFWYLNNGITIVCEECVYNLTRSPRAKLVNFQIVNGGQTSHSLFEAYLEEPQKLENVDILVRICETRTNQSISSKIGETTNSQIPVKTRDLHSNDSIQKKLEEEFLALGYFYERKINYYSNEPKESRLDNELLGQLSLAYFFGKPSKAKGEKYIVFGEMYDKIFDEETTTAAKLMTPISLFKPIDLKKREVQKRRRKREEVNLEEYCYSIAPFHILYAAKLFCDKLKYDTSKKEEIDAAIKKGAELVFAILNDQLVENNLSKYNVEKFLRDSRSDSKIQEKFSQIK